MVGRLCWNGHVLLYVVRQIVQLRHPTPVSHVGTEEDDLDGVGTVDGEKKDDDVHSPLVDANLADVLVQVSLRHHGGLSQQPPARLVRDSNSPSHSITVA